MNKSFQKIKIKSLSSLDKVFLNCEPKEVKKCLYSMFKNESFSFQIAYSDIDESEEDFKLLTVNVECKDENDKNCIKLYSVGLVPSEMPAYPKTCDNYITTIPGLFPDPLYPITSNCELKTIKNQWRAIWIEFTPNENTSPGIHQFNIIFKDKNNNILANSLEEVEIINAFLPEQKLIRTEWFHTDCLCTEYNIKAMSDDYWDTVKNYIKCAVNRGINMILTPIFTPPLDTEIGKERPTIQLIDIEYKNNKYLFDFSNLLRWINICKECNVKYLEISHLFTQWGAKFTPKIMANTENGYRQIFGWDISATSNEYKEFISEFMPLLTNFLKENWDCEKVFFHVSDEPSLEHLENYKNAKNIIAPFLQDFKIIDALSNYEFYKTGVLTKPIPANNHIEPFLEANIDGLWTYYCCSQHKYVSNRFMSMPSERCRIIGTQLFKYNIEGFLHWGFNFWYSQFSKKQINPYYTTDSALGFPSGDAFLVYPAKDKSPIESIRIVLMDYALYDMRAMKMLENLTSHEYVVSLIDKNIDPITFSKYPHNAEWLLNMRQRINEEIKRHL